MAASSILSRALRARLYSAVGSLHGYIGSRGYFDPRDAITRLQSAPESDSAWVDLIEDLSALLADLGVVVSDLEADNDRLREDNDFLRGFVNDQEANAAKANPSVIDAGRSRRVRAVPNDLRVLLDRCRSQGMSQQELADALDDNANEVEKVLGKEAAAAYRPARGGSWSPTQVNRLMEKCGLGSLNSGMDQRRKANRISLFDLAKQEQARELAKISRKRTIGS